MKYPPASWKLADHEGPLVVNTEHFSLRSKRSSHLWNLMWDRFALHLSQFKVNLCPCHLKHPDTQPCFLLWLLFFFCCCCFQLFGLNVLWGGSLQGAPVSTVFFFSPPFFYLPRNMQRCGPIQEVDFGNKSVQTHPGVRRVRWKSCRNLKTLDVT